MDTVPAVGHTQRRTQRANADTEFTEEIQLDAHKACGSRGCRSVAEEYDGRGIMFLYILPRRAAGRDPMRVGSESD